MLLMATTAELLAAAVRNARGDLRQEQLAERLGKHQSWISRRESGDTIITPSDIEDIERALGIPLGSIYSACGLIDPGVITRAAIGKDPDLSEDARILILAAYDAAVRTTRMHRRVHRGDGRLD